MLLVNYHSSLPLLKIQVRYDPFLVNPKTVKRRNLYNKLRQLKKYLQILILNTTNGVLSY